MNANKNRRVSKNQNPIKGSEIILEEMRQYQNAFQLHQDGKIADALAIYRTLLSTNSGNADLMQLVGCAFLSLNDQDNAISYLRLALKLDPSQPHVLINLGNAYYSDKKFAEAIDCYSKVLDLQPSNETAAQVYNNLGLANRRLGKTEEAVRCYKKAIQIFPKFAEAFNNLGVAEANRERIEESIIAFTNAVAINPDFAEAFSNRSARKSEAGRHLEALEDINRAIELKPNLANAHFEKGNILSDIGNYKCAIESYNCALVLDPNFVGAYINRGVAERATKNFLGAIASFNHAIALNPKSVEAFNDRGITFKALERHEEALSDYNYAISLDPNCAEAFWNKSQLLLLLGNYSEGWRYYEYRWKRRNSIKTNNFGAPLWLGKDSLAQKTILLQSEQGLGDTVQMLRYLPTVCERAGAVILELCQELLVLTKSTPFPKNLQLLSKGQSFPNVNYFCPLMSLPLAFNTTIATIPARIPYLKAPPSKVGTWRSTFASSQKPNVGLVWRGSPNHADDYIRSIPFQQILPLLTVNATFYSLQKDYIDREFVELKDCTDIKDISSQLEDLSDTAAIIESLDLIITVDTCVAHLAGALGKPVWILLRKGPDFRWLLNRTDSPWYPTAKLFRQSSLDNWSPVITEVKEALKDFTKK